MENDNNNIVESKKNEAKNNVAKKALIIIASFYFIVMFTFYPLYINGKYTYLCTQKFSIYLIISAITLFSALVFLIVYVCTEYSSVGNIIRSSFKSLSLIDKFVIAYALAVMISFLLSNYKQTALIGLDGWWTGLVTCLIICLTYFLVSRNLQYEKYFLHVILIASAIVYLIGIIQRLGFDPFMLYASLSPGASRSYLSTIGNNNWFANYFCVTFPLGVWAFLYTQSKKETYLLAAFIAIACFVMVAQRSNSVFLGMIGAFLFMMWFSFDSYKSLKNYCTLILICLLSFRVYGLISLLFENAAALKTLPLFLCFNSLMYIPIIFMCIVYLIIDLCEKKEVDFKKFKIIRFVLALIAAASALILILIFILINTTSLFEGGNGSQSSYTLRFSEEWGNWRGRLWMHGLNVYREFPLLEKLFGCGPDCFSAYSYDYYGNVMKDVFSGYRITNAHNEFITSLVNIGLIGTIAYYGVFVSAIITFIKNRQKLMIAGGAAVCVVAYVFNTMVSFQMITSTPLLFLLIALISNLHRSHGLGMYNDKNIATSSGLKTDDAG